MARTKTIESAPLTTHDVATENTLPAVRIAEQQNLAALITVASDERDLLNQLLGQAQMANAFGKFSQTVWSSKLAFVKENKLYRALAGKKSPNGLELHGTWEEFCKLLGITDEKANQDIANLSAFGAEALESMSSMGIGYRELRQFRKLPEDQKLALIEVAKTGDKESFVELAEEIITKHVKEKAALEADLEASRNIAAIRQDGLDKARLEIEQKTVELERAKRHFDMLAPDKAATEIRNELTQGAREIEIYILKLRKGLETLISFAQAHGIEQQGPFLAGLFAQIELSLNQVRGEFNIPQQLDTNPVPLWLRDDVDSDEIVAQALANAAAVQA